MKAFIIHLNGKRLWTVGIGPSGVLTTDVTWVGGIPKRTDEGDLIFHVGGLDSRTDEHVKWNVPELKVGDKVTVKIVETDKVDPESKRYTDRPRKKAAVRRRGNAGGHKSPKPKGGASRGG